MFVLTKENSITVEVKKSRFIAHALAVTCAEEALHRVEVMRDPEATHNCWAYRIGDAYRFSDDGEPGGTAGRPIFAAIEKQAVDRCFVLVTRFFGGIKLGAGGLARAYGGAAAESLRTAEKEVLKVRVMRTIRAPFDAIGGIYPLMRRFDIDKCDETYGADGVSITLWLPLENLNGFAAALADATGAKAVILSEGAS